MISSVATNLNMNVAMPVKEGIHETEPVTLSWYTVGWGVHIRVDRPFEIAMVNLREQQRDT